MRLQTFHFLSRSCRSTTGVSIVPTMPRPISKPIEDSGGYLFTLWQNRSSHSYRLLPVNTPCKAFLILSALSYGKWESDVLVVSPGFVATDIRQRALGADGQPLGQSPRDGAKAICRWRNVCIKSSGRWNDANGAHHDVERQSDTLAA